MSNSTQDALTAAHINRLQAEIAELKAEIEHLRDERNRELGYNTLMALYNMSVQAIQELKAENARLSCKWEKKL